MERHRGGASPTAERLGRLPAPMSVAEMAARAWDVIVVGAGHNGLTCAAYLARAGRRVLVLESRDRVGGACTLDEPWPGYRVSPVRLPGGAAAPAGDRGTRAWPGAWFAVGARPARGCSSRSRTGRRCNWARTTPSARRRSASLNPDDLSGWRAMGDVKRRLRDALRPVGDGDLWVGPAPSPGADRGPFEAATPRPSRCCSTGRWSNTSSGYLSDERIQMAYLGQGVIGTNASPHDPGTASVHFHHASGRLGGEPGMWGYVVGGMGMVSFLSVRRGPRRRRRGRHRHPGRADRARPRGSSWKGATGSTPRSWCPTPTPKRVTLRSDRKRRRPRVEAIRSNRCRSRAARSSSTWPCASFPTSPPGPGTRQPHHFGQINTPADQGQEWREVSRDRPRRRANCPDSALDRAVFPDRPRPQRGPGGGPHHERVRTVGPLCVRREGTWDEPPRRGRGPGVGLDRPVLLEPARRRPDRGPGARPARH